MNDSTYISTGSLIHWYEKNKLLKEIEDNSITDSITYFPEWWEEAERILLSLPDKPDNDGKRLYFDTSGWNTPLKTFPDDRAYTPRETTMALFAKLAERFTDYNINGSFPLKMLLAINCSISAYSVIYNIPLYEDMASCAYRVPDPTLADAVIAAGKQAIEQLSEAETGYMYISEIESEINEYALSLRKLYDRFDSLAEEIRRKINSPEECVKLARETETAAEAPGDMLVIFGNGTYVNIPAERLDDVPAGQRRQHAEELAKEILSDADAVYNEDLGLDTANEYCDVVYLYGSREHGTKLLYRASPLYHELDVAIADEHYSNDRKEKQIADVLMSDPDQ